MAKRTKFQIRSDAARQRWHVRDEQKEDFWRRHVEEWRKSGLSQSAYCKKYKLSYSSFLAWKREIEIREREKDPPANVAALLSTVGENTTSPFVPIRIVSDKASEKVEPEPKPAERKQIEIALPTGVVIRLDDGCDPGFVGKLLSSVKF